MTTPDVTAALATGGILAMIIAIAAYCCQTACWCANAKWQ
eukprot:CAMPEP_0202886824 /NCGR_PEP_ID=MMETSP1391-20130828/42368_1 /ASSEMBLY_ACC=CAM_ASM_000867 /TAXON_ID=1034604 /ORGANISM="Chlamydomonas leiostraca, Strain SAG 11-49" /LENGTH=39 /DNA_ID= /DNA_START= /DNA_END= /DNA_ORIENTATION=